MSKQIPNSAGVVPQPILFLQVTPANKNIQGETLKNITDRVATSIEGSYLLKNINPSFVELISKLNEIE